VIVCFTPSPAHSLVCNTHALFARYFSQVPRKFYFVLNRTKDMESIVLDSMHASHPPRAYIPGYKKTTPTRLGKVSHMHHVCGHVERA